MSQREGSKLSTSMSPVLIALCKADLPAGYRWLEWISSS